MPCIRSSSGLTSTQKIERASLNQVFATQDPAYLQQLSKVMAEEATRRRKAGQRYHGHELIKDVADFKARVKLLAAARVHETNKRKTSSSFLLSSSFCNQKDFRLGAPRWEYMKGEATLAIDEPARLVRYIVSI